MFTVYHSNQLDVLKSLLVELIRRDPLANPLQAEQILVQSPGMSQWLKLALANEQGIAANLAFPLPATFIWQLFIDVLEGVPQRSAFNKEAMTWKLVKLLPDFLEHPEFVPLARYLEEDNDGLKTFQLARKIADIFDQYLVYRPEWMAAWEAGETVPEHEELHPWQPILWRAIYQMTTDLGQSHYHRGNLYQTFIETLVAHQARGTVPDNLPDRLFVFGISALPPRYLDALEALGAHIDVHLMFTNPCQHYWGDIRDQRFIDRLARRTHRQIVWRDDHSEVIGERPTLKGEPQAYIDDVHGHQVGNSLLASMGKLGRDNLCLLAEKEPLDIDAFVEIDRRGLLQHIQADILELEDRDNHALALDSQHKIGLTCGDDSLSIHACHSAMREVEVLQDQLLAMFDRDPTLSARDIVVMVSDINQYSPAIQAVFGNAPNDRYIPFSISDRTADTENPILLAFHHLLLLPRQRCSASELQSLLEVPAIMRRFDIASEQLPTLTQWLQECGVRWGLNAQTATQFDLPSQHVNTWLFGLQRMLLGYAMPAGMGIYEEQLAYDEVQGLNAELAGKLGLFIEQVIWLREALQSPKSGIAWQALINQILDKLFCFEADDERVVTLVRDKVEQLVTQLQDATFDEALGHGVIISYFRDALNNERVSQRFLAGQLNFCTLMPMRSIPFRVVCLLGMNDGSYPRSVNREGFDLMALHNKRGDRSRRDDDRYLFLEALLSAQDTLYISYVGRSIRDNSELAPSILVSELLDYCQAGYCLSTDHALEPADSATSLRDALVRQHTLTPYSAASFSSQRPSYAKEWLPHSRTLTPDHEKNAGFALDGLSPHEWGEENITLPELIRFWRLPVQYFFNRRLKVWFGDIASSVNDDEPFVFEPLERYQTRHAMLEWVIHHGDDESALTAFRADQKAAGKLPHAAFGALTLTDIEKDILPLGQRIRTMAVGPQPDVEVRLPGLEGWIRHRYAVGLVRYRPGKWRSQDLLSTWIEHCCLNAMGHAEPTFFIALDAELVFKALSVDEAKSHVDAYLKGMREGMNQPIAYFPLTALAGLENPDKASQKMAAAFESGFMPGEGENAYIQRVWSRWGEALESDVLALAEQWLSPALAQVKIEKGE
ncbi:exodeoxyribonuclease V subunit gamma [Thaumasiovibrio subtropicus]|uniref:exodeoxyribonuclease V subunit gamma n=1 Tax=Thaumasiovibrio subtropicus TaxID=1891207 RepID=UPI000B358BE6|nr:exodeoxyribonuclease V subunit gamma [Thaumasiovibrio subtropicus]